MTENLNMVGKRVHMLEVVERLDGSLLRCLFDCGNERVIRVGHFNTGHMKSCGCHKPHHGKSGSREAICYSNMLARCHNPKNKRFKDYGAKGILVCERWRNSASAFHEDMGDCPDGFTIDRIDNTKGYYPDNCRWVSRAENQRNRMISKRWFVHEIEFPAAQEAADYFHVTVATIKAWCEGRLAKGRWYDPKDGCWTEHLYDQVA